MKAKVGVATNYHKERSSVTGYSDPEDEKCLDKHGWYTLNRKCAGNARTDPVVERVEAVAIRYNYRQGSQSMY